MALDGTGIILILLFFLRGYFRGFIVAAFSVIAILLGILCALKLSQAFSSWLLERGYTTLGWAPIISYVVLFIGVVILVRIIAKLLEKAVEGLMLGIVNKILGGVLYAFLGVILWSSFLWIGSQMHLITPEMIAGSKTYSFVSKIAPWFFEMSGKLLPFVKDTFANLQHFFDTINLKK